MEVAQETWLGFLLGLGTFESPCLRTERSALACANGCTFPRRQRARGGPWQGSARSAGGLAPPGAMGGQGSRPLRHTRAGEAGASWHRAVGPPQRQVVTLRDVEGLSSVQVCDVLGITEREPAGAGASVAGHESGMSSRRRCCHEVASAPAERPRRDTPAGSGVGHAYLDDELPCGAGSRFEARLHECDVGGSTSGRSR